MAKDGKMSLPSVDGVKPGQEMRLKEGENIVNGIPEIGSPHPDKAYKDDDPANFMSQLRQWKTAEAQLDKQDAARLRSIWRQLEESGATTKDGQHVSNKAQTIRWIIQTHPGL